MIYQPPTPHHILPSNLRHGYKADPRQRAELKTKEVEVDRCLCRNSEHSPNSTFKLAKSSGWFCKSLYTYF
jgi:hypothetical protein